MRLKDRVAVITGAAQGIGLACAERFKAEGAKLMLSDINDAVGQAAAAHLEAPFIHADAGSKSDVEALIRRAVEIHGRVDIMMSNAGITHAAEFLELGEDDFDRVIRTNMKSVFLCGQAAARQMVRQGGGGAIVSMSSVNALLAIPNQVAYGASKGAILTHSNFAANAINLLTCWSITANDRLLMPLPLFHVHGLGNAVWR